MKNKWIRMLSLLLMGTILLPTLAACNNEPEQPAQNPEDSEGTKESEEAPSGEPSKLDYVIKLDYDESKSAVLADWSKVKNNANMSRNTRIKYKDESASLFWHASNLVSPGAISVTDWTDYNTLSFSIYSQSKCGATVQIRFSGPNVAGTNMDPYFRYQFKVDWEGWKDFTIRFDELDSNYNPTLSALTSVHLDCSGWGMTPNPDCKLYFSSIRLVNRNPVLTPSPDTLEASDFTKAKDNWRKLIAGTEATNSSGTENVTSMLASVDQKCKSALDRFDSTFRAGERNSLFGFEIVQGRGGDEAKISSLYSLLRDMAIGYATFGSQYYQDAALLAKIKDGLDYSYNFYYGPNVWLEGTYGNWWHWDIGIPLELTIILLLLENELGSELVKKYLEPFDYLNEYPSMTACNKTWVTYCIFASALLQNDAERMLISQELFAEVFDYVMIGDGFYTDGSFIQHDKHPYTGGYALSMLAVLSDIMYVLHDTRFEIIPEIYPSVNHQYAWVFESFQPVMYNGLLFAGMRGREMSRNTSETAAGNSAIASMIKMAQYAPAEVKARLEPLVKYFITAGAQDYTTLVPIAFSDYTAELKKNDSIKARSDYNITHVFGMMDRVVTHNNKYAASVSLNSTRIWKYEAINNENMDGWYLGDGMIYIYTDGYDYNYDFFSSSDPYKMPGTTVTEEQRKQENLNGGILNGSAFAGGVSIGEYGIAVYDQVPGKNDYFDSKLYARKSYFMFDDEIVAVGSGIKDTSGTMVNTIVEDRIWREGDVLTVNGEKVSPDFGNEYSSSEITSMHFSNMGGYVFLDAQDMKYQMADGERADFLEIWMEHGTNPSDAGYSYVYLPEATPEATAAYQANPGIEILSKTDKIHAVKDTDLGITGYAFYEAGSCNGVTANQAVALMVKEGNDGVTVSVSDPTHLLKKATVTIELDQLGTSVTAPENIKASVNGNTLTLEIDFTNNVGQSFTVSVK